MVVLPSDTRITVDRNHHRGVDTLTAKIIMVKKIKWVDFKSEL